MKRILIQGVIWEFKNNSVTGYSPKTHVNKLKQPYYFLT